MIPPPAKKYGPPSKILIVIIKDIGDVLLSAPCAEIIKKNFPSARVDYLAEARCAPVLQNNPFIDNIVIYDHKKPLKMICRIRAAGYDWVIDLLRNPRSSLLTALSGAKVRAGDMRNKHSFYAYNYRLQTPPEDLYGPDYKLHLLRQLGLKWDGAHAPLAKYYLTKDQLRERDKSWLAAGVKPDEKIIGFYPTPRMETRRWPAKNFRELAQMLHEQYSLKIFVFYGPGEEDLAQAVVRDMPPYIQLAPEAKDLGALMALLGRLEVLIASCGGTKHMALAAGAATVTTHTANRAQNWTPVFDPRHIAVSAQNTPCSPCFRHECNNNFICMDDVSPRRVFEAAQKILG
ncbi:MAG: glycosyltransferase family 9 protein [Elusimicrobiota bacterium]|jgi:ADP-heptose:LPS heptosyltransferase|nr:glycosyltransferase family 9 protein [Elusimicrobiota bacterium]